MPGSYETFNAVVRAFIKDNAYRKYLDVGAGAGNYGKLIRSAAPTAYIEAIEAHLPYIKKFGLATIYDEVHHAKVEEYFEDKPAYNTDVVIMGDVIEHLKKSDGVDLLHFLVYRCHFLMVVFPTKYVQYDAGGVKDEAHRSVWSEEDFSQFDYDFKQEGIMNMALIKGYLGDKEAVVNIDK